MNSNLKWDEKQEIIDMCRSPYRGWGEPREKRVEKKKKKKKKNKEKTFRF